MSTSSTSRSLIVGGETVPDASTEFPAFVWSGIASDGWGCGGALIHSDIVISAAHCAVSFVNNANNYIGPTWITGENATFFPTQRTLVHPNYNWPTKVNDIIIVKLDGHSDAKPFRYNTDSSFPAVNSTATVAGFGWIKVGGPLSDIMRKVDIEIFPFDVCNKTYAQYPFNLTDEMHVCAGTWEGGKDGCASDSGAPLFVGNTIIGITEDGLGCGRPGVPAYYTRVSNQAKWISESICLLSDRPPRHCRKMDIQWTLPPTVAPSPSPTHFPTKFPTSAPSMPTASPTVSQAPTVSMAPTLMPSLAPIPFRLRPANNDTSTEKWRVSTMAFRAFVFWVIVAGIVGFAIGGLVRWMRSGHRRQAYEKIPSVTVEKTRTTTAADPETDEVTPANGS